VVDLSANSFYTSDENSYTKLNKSIDNNEFVSQRNWSFGVNWAQNTGSNFD
jgi:hypothetical protein